MKEASCSNFQLPRVDAHRDFVFLFMSLKKAQGTVCSQSSFAEC